MNFEAHEAVDEEGAAPPIRDLSVEFVQGIARQYRELRNLNLSYNEISDAVNLRLLPSLQAVDLSHNQLAYLPNLDLPQLRVLNLADNCIFYAEALSRLPGLELLDLRRNNITSCQSVSGLAELPRLREIWLEGNPVASAPDYRIAVLSLLPTVRTLDGAQVTAGERRHASTFSGSPNGYQADGAADNNALDASSVSLRPSIEIHDHEDQRRDLRFRSNLHHNTADHDSDEDSIGMRPDLGNLEKHTDSRASKVIQRTRQLLDQAKQSREKAHAAAARVSQKPPTGDRNDVAIPHSRQRRQTESLANAARTGQTLRTATRGLIASRRFSGGTSPMLPPMWNDADADSDQSVGQSDGDALAPPEDSPRSTDDEIVTGTQSQVAGGSKMASAATAIRWKVKALSRERKIRELEARVTEERLAADRMRKYFDHQALNAFQDAMHEQQSSRNRQQGVTEAQAVTDLRRQLASAQRQLAVQEQVMCMQESAIHASASSLNLPSPPQIQQPGGQSPRTSNTGSSGSGGPHGDVETGSLDRVLSSSAAASSTQALLLHTWRQQVFKLLVQRESEALMADNKASEAKANMAQMTRSLECSAKSNEVLRSKLEAKAVELERRTDEVLQLRGVAADATRGASQSRGLSQQQLSSVRTGLRSLEESIKREEGRVAQAFRKLLVFDKRVGFACSRVRMLASVLKTRLRSAALRSTPQYKSGEPMNNRRMLLDQRAPTAIDGHLISLEAGSLDIAAAQAISAECRSLRRERDFLLRSMQDMQQQQEATSHAAEELGSAAQQSLQREAKRRRELVTQMEALQAKLRTSEQNSAATVNRLKETWAQEEAGLRELLAEQDAALAAARDENSSLRKTEAKQLFGIRQVERDLDRERREREDEREEFSQQISTLQHSLSATRRQLNDIKRDRASLLAALRDTENLPKQPSSRTEKLRKSNAPRSRNHRGQASSNNEKRLLPRPINNATLTARTSAQKLQERLSGLLELSSSLLRDGGDLDDEVDDSDSSEAPHSQHEAASHSSIE